MFANLIAYRSRKAKQDPENYKFVMVHHSFSLKVGKKLGQGHDIALSELTTGTQQICVKSILYSLHLEI
jgi:hypothetical protein